MAARPADSGSAAKASPPELTAAVDRLSGVGPKLAEKLASLGITKVVDLLFHLPYRYEDRTHVTPVSALRAGMSAVIEGSIRGSQIRYGRRRSLICEMADGSGLIRLRLFYFSKKQQSQLQRGRHIRCYGEIRHGPQGLEMVHPEYQVQADRALPPLDSCLTPRYPATEGINQTRLRTLITQALAALKATGDLVDWLPMSWLEPWGLPNLQTAIRLLHQPSQQTDMQALLAGTHRAQQRLALEELLAHHLGLLRRRHQSALQSSKALAHSSLLIPALLKTLPFKLTSAQQRVAAEIAADLNRPIAMLRLLQGDVGAGKTLVALLAALQAIEAGMQVSLMAPTELLAEQHFLTLQRWCAPLDVRLDLLSGSTPKNIREDLLQSLQQGEIQLLVGTHALFQNSVHFAQLALVIIDEQHRFGVQQRLALQQKAVQGNPHQLTLSATPIPRTLAMTMFADMDVSVLDELPPGRTPVTTTLIKQSKRESVVHRVDAACESGRQVYWVCTLITASDELSAQAAEATAAYLKAALPKRRIGLLHGQLKPAHKSDVMRAFKDHNLDILVATTVIEVGVDVANASVMIIENPERLGLAQLHQLRGRVGRGNSESFCLLLCDDNLSNEAIQRLNVIRQTHDGFEIAQQDLQLRGAGELLGTRQAGSIKFRIADLSRDLNLLEKVTVLASRLGQEYPHYVEPLIERWLKQADRFQDV